MPLITVYIPKSMAKAFDYYYGLPSGPPLIASTKPQPTAVKGRPVQGHPALKAIHPINLKHPIVDVWENKISGEIIKVLTDSKIDWTSLEVVHIYAAEDQSLGLGPAIIWVGIEPVDNLDHHLGEEVAIQCQAIIDQHKINDCYVELRASKRQDSAGVRFLDLTDPNEDLAYEYKGPFRSTLGFPICSKKTPHKIGSGGFYISAGGDDDQVYMVTARHVVLQDSFEDSQKEYIKLNKSQPRQDILLNGNKIPEKLAGMASRISNLEYSISRPSRNPEEKNSLTKGWSEEINALKNLQREIQSQWSTPESQVLGELVWAPPITFSTASNTTTLDLAVVRIDPGKLDHKNYIGNAIDFGQVPDTTQIYQAVHDDCRNGPQFKIPHDSRMILRDQTPMDEVLSPLMRDRNNEECIALFKRGASSNLTFGKGIGISCYTRKMWEGHENLSREWGVIGLGRLSARTNRFSERGDSGACVADVYERVSGMLLGGCGYEKGITDISYVTPVHLEKYWVPHLKDSPILGSASLDETVVPVVATVLPADNDSGIGVRRGLLGTSRPESSFLSNHSDEISTEVCECLISSSCSVYDLWYGIQADLRLGLNEMNIKWMGTKLLHDPYWKSRSVGHFIAVIKVIPGTLTLVEGAIVATRVQAFIDKRGIPDCFVEIM
ncbi:hypothetical protein AOL_s00006g175 [Orbilia oligospora ATCC 24927]|uniref:Uncharacterized protein n=1 Tax=Arthrobotrys oligospora (strain ATCC 24927 / CBS 115.81 / DSM 1491) TaxID=756982 RepID=G1WZX4_ARTOA|nr:hypothetical protein AOL_s00006g175 [Orbilia oligospora ATCC 24927]EGX53309.1 hypothetical protein AOL_s00006g175 [Orbilia oligospora ATCC 24927]